MKIKKPSVSDLLDLLAKPALIKWANKQGLLGVDISQKRKKSMERGTSLHSQIEDYCMHGVLMESEASQHNLENFLQGKEILSMEKQIETEWFVGRYDLAFSFNGEKWLGDFKSGFKGKIYLEHKLQLVAYAMAEPVEKLAIVPIPQFQLCPVDIENREPYEKMLKALSEIWKLKQEIENV